MFTLEEALFLFECVFKENATETLDENLKNEEICCKILSNTDLNKGSINTYLEEIRKYR